MKISSLIQLFSALLLLMCANVCKAQSNVLVLNGAYITINNGTYASPVYLVVNAGQPSAILRNSGAIISEKEGNYVQWNTTDVTTTTSYVFPFGTSSAYLPVTLYKNSIGSGPGHVDNSSSMILSTWASAVDNTAWANAVTNMNGSGGADASTAAIDRWWQVKIGMNVNATFDVTYRGAENTTAVPFGTFTGQNWNATISQWAVPGTGSGTGVTAGTGTVNGITLTPHGTGTSSPYILTSTSTPLPIELVNFTASCDDHLMHINWEDATETNVMNIELQKSYDLNSWITIYVASPSNEDHSTFYHFEYTESNGSVVYYRLKTNNNDGNSDLSTVIYTSPCDAQTDNITAFYGNNLLNVHTHFETGSHINYALYDLQGKKVAEGEFTAAEGDALTSLSLTILNDAIYIFRAESATATYNQKLLIQQ